MRVDLPSSLVNRHIALLGTGYIGGSVVLAARRAGMVARVTGFDSMPEAAQAARTRGIVDEISPSAAEAVRGADIVVLAAPVASLAPLAAAIASALSRDAVVIDVGSVKASLAALAGRLGGRFVGCHPLAGTERSGPGAADERLFEGRVCFVCPGDARPDAVGVATAFWTAVGARVVQMDADRHDALMAAVSHLPHVAAFALAASLAGVAASPETTRAAGGPTTSLRDTTRIAASSPQVWRDIFLENRAQLLPLVRALEAKVGALREAVESGDGERLAALLAEGRTARERLMRDA